MTFRSFVPWVEPIAAQLREGRSQIVEAARAVPVEAWARPSPSSGWTYRDLLVHLAVGDWVCQTVLRAVVANERLDVAATFGSVDAGNERLRQERTSRSVEELIAEVEAEGEETQGLLAELTDADESRSEEDAPMNLGQYLREFPGHDRAHLEELRTALP
jgi:hypothetical protein